MHRRRILAVAAATTLLAGVAAPALADSPSPTASPAPTQAPTRPALAAVQAAAAAAISARLTALSNAVGRVSANKGITSADRTTVLATLNSDTSGLNALAPRIAADTTVVQALADNRMIYSTFRVFAVALPQSFYATAADDLTGTALPAMTAAEHTLATLLAGPDASKNTTAVQAEMADLSAKIAGATAATNGLAANALAVTPAGYDANHTVLSPIRAQALTAAADAQAARSDITAVKAALES